MNRIAAAFFPLLLLSGCRGFTTSVTLGYQGATASFTLVPPAKAGDTDLEGAAKALGQLVEPSK